MRSLQRSFRRVQQSVGGTDEVMAAKAPRSNSERAKDGHPLEGAIEIIGVVVKCLTGLLHPVQICAHDGDKLMPRT